MKNIERPIYLEKMKRLKGSPDIKIITGIRRAGKSKLLLSYIEWLRSINPDDNIIFIDLLLLQNEALREYHALHEAIEAQYRNGVNNYLCIDEVQMCSDFELAINSLHQMGKYDIYLTGSNAFLLSSDLATLFTGRVIQIEVFPFSFSEYRMYFGDDDDKQEQFDQYITDGGFSGSYPYTHLTDRTQYVKEVYKTIIQRDMVERYNLPDTTVLSRLAEYMMDNVSNITSPNNLVTNLIADGSQTNRTTIARYLEHLEHSFMFYLVGRYDVKGKKYLQSLGKYYIVDSGIRYAVLGRRNMDYGRVYENIVAIELKRRGYEIYVGKLYQKEIDFVAIQGNEKIYIQVSDNITEPETLNREIEPLLKIRDAYPKFLIARTRHEIYDYQGIKIIDLASWLLTS